MKASLTWLVTALNVVVVVLVSARYPHMIRDIRCRKPRHYFLDENMREFVL